MWTYWRTKGDWDGLITADNGQCHCMWFPEVGQWCYPGPSSTYDPEHWQETSRLEYLSRAGEALPEPPAGTKREWEEDYNGRS